MGANAPGTDIEAGKIWWLIFYITLALGVLAKGPVAWLPIGGLILGRVLRKDFFRLPVTETVAGICLAAALAALWGIPALEQTQGQYWTVGMGEHVISIVQPASLTAMDSKGLGGFIGPCCLCIS